MSPALPAPAVGDPASQLNFEAIAALINPPVVTALPTNPYNGQEINYLADAASGVVWGLKYRAASPSSYKWEFIGGPPMHTPISGDMTTTSAVDVLMTGSPSLTLPPLAGDYWITLSMTYTATGGLAQATVYAAGSPTSVVTIVGASGWWDISNLAKLSGSSPSAVLNVYVKNANAGSTRFVNGQISAIPIRVG